MKWSIFHDIMITEMDNDGHFVSHDHVIKWKPRYLSFMRGIHRSPGNSSHKSQSRRTLMFSFVCAWTYGWVNNRDAGDFKRHRAHYDVVAIQTDIVEEAGHISRYHECHSGQRWTFLMLFSIIYKTWQRQQYPNRPLLSIKYLLDYTVFISVPSHVTAMVRSLV